jgi:4-carboxymuconolactone decarboxylase
MAACGGSELNETLTGTRALVALAAAIVAADRHTIELLATAALAAGVPPLSLDELVLQSVLTVGWPRALVAASACRATVGAPAENASDDLDYAAHAQWTARGEVTCQVIYGEQYDKLRGNVHALHPALAAWMVTEGYGRTLSRPGLSLRLRELCTVAQTAALHTPRQLHSHLLGALRAGATTDDIDATLEEAAPFVPATDREEISRLWSRVRDSWRQSQ